MKIPHPSANSDFPDLPDLSAFSDLTLESVPLQICNETVTDESLHTLASLVVSALQHANKTVATAESLTGGYIAKTLTDISGASGVLEGAVVSYSDRIKHKLLGVQTQTLQTYTAVSAQTAAEMAKGIRLAVGADIGISVTGVAGPTGGTAQTPVGCVFLGCATTNGIAVTRLQCGGHANKATSQTTHDPLADVKEELLTKAAGEQQTNGIKQNTFLQRDNVRRQTVQAALQCILQTLQTTK